MEKICMVVDDMFFAAKIRGAAQSCGREIESVKTAEQVVKMIGDPPAMVIVDLNSNRLDPIEVLKRIKGEASMKDVPVVGFLSHVQLDLKQAAEAAGCDYVIPRSAFSMKLPEIVAGNLDSLRARP
jgi:CheY-like chemotaxis protein